MEWELEWVDKHPHLYDSPLHAEAVKRNIEKRYLINEMSSKIKELEKFMYAVGLDHQEAPSTQENNGV